MTQAEIKRQQTLIGLKPPQLIIQHVSNFVTLAGEKAPNKWPKQKSSSNNKNSLSEQQTLLSNLALGKPWKHALQERVGTEQINTVTFMEQGNTGQTT